MKIIKLIPQPHNIKIGQDCPYYEPNIKEDCIFVDETGTPIGFYMRQMPEKMCKLADLANHELLSNRVPKTKMRRASVLKAQKKLGLSSKQADEIGVAQFSTIIGSIPPKPMMKRHYPNQSSVHKVKSAQDFIKAMMMLVMESEKLIKELTPNVYEEQVKLFNEVPKEWRFGNLFTSSISNFNISASFHRDTGNIVGAVNVIITKRLNSKGGNLNVPDYGATMDQCDNSILVYPAWRNIHGVTPIIPTHEGGYRNSLVFYPLQAFLKSNLTKTNTTIGSEGEYPKKDGSDK
jgi:hypothetical protein